MVVCVHVCAHTHSHNPPTPADSSSAFLTFLLKAPFVHVYRESQKLSGFPLPLSSFVGRGPFLFGVLCLF